MYSKEIIEVIIVLRIKVQFSFSFLNLSFVVNSDRITIVMSHEIQAEHHSAYSLRKSFKSLFANIDFIELLHSLLKILRFFFYGPVTYVFYAVFSFLYSFIVNIEIFENTKIFTIIFGALFGPVLIYLFGTYLTMLPYYVVIPLVFFDYKKVMPFLLLVMCINFIQLLAI